MRISEWLRQHPDLPTTVPDNSSLKEIFSLMLDAPFPKDIYLTADGNHVVGHLSLKKIAHQLLTRYQPIHTRRQIIHRITGGTVRELMDTEFAYARPEEELEDVFFLLLERDIEELPIIDHAGTLAGVVKLTTLLRYLVDTEEADTLCKLG